MRLVTYFFKSALSSFGIDFDFDQYKYRDSNYTDKEIEELQSILDDALNERESTIIKMHFGLKDGRSKSPSTIGEIFHISTERVKDIERKAFRKLHHPDYSARLILWYDQDGELFQAIEAKIALLKPTAEEIDRQIKELRLQSDYIRYKKVSELRNRSINLSRKNVSDD